MLIGIYSPAPQSGKSTLARALVDAGFTCRRFADPIKNMVRALLCARAIPADTIERMVDGDLKEAPIDGIGATPRQIMQTLGTEWGRDTIAGNLWVSTLMAGVSGHTVVDDMRFENEYDAMSESGAFLIRIIRPGAIGGGGHASEGRLCGRGFDKTIVNSGTLAEFDVRCQAFAASIDRWASCFHEPIRLARGGNEGIRRFWEGVDARPKQADGSARFTEDAATV